MANTNDISVILELNEELKELHKKTDQISMIALNAMLMARKNNKAEQGFAVVTTELRTFCSELSNRSKKLSSYIFRIVLQLSNQLKFQNYHRIIEKTQHLSCQSNINNPSLNRMIEQHKSQGNELQRSLDQIKQELLVELDRTIKRCEIGESLGVLAKVESQSGQGKGALRLVADQISKSMDEIQVTLKKATEEIK